MSEAHPSFEEHKFDRQQQGAVAIYNGSHWLALEPGDAGQVIIMGSDGLPSWGDAFVTGMIQLWSGSIVSIPSGWALCDGSNGTPDLRNSFVVGAGDTYAVDATGGSATQANHTGHGDHGDHSGHSNHSSHSLSDMLHTHQIDTDGGHDHNDFPHDHGAQTSAPGAFGGDHSAITNIADTTDSMPIEGSHAHGGETQGGAPSAMSHSSHSSHSSHANNGAISAHGTNLPPYFALAYIMKVAS